MAGIGVSMTLGVYERAKFFLLGYLVFSLLAQEELKLFTVWEGGLAGT